MIIVDYPTPCPICGHVFKDIHDRVIRDLGHKDDGVHHFVLTVECDECEQKLTVIQALGARDYFTALGILADSGANQDARNRSRALTDVHTS